MVQARRVPPARGIVAVHHSARLCAVSEITALCFDDRKRKIVLGEANGTVKVCIAQDAARNSHGECSGHPRTIQQHRQSATCSGIAMFGLLQDAPGAQHATVTMVRHATVRQVCNYLNGAVMKVVGKHKNEVSSLFYDERSKCGCSTMCHAAARCPVSHRGTL